MSEQYPQKQIRSIYIDTLTGIMNEMYMTARQKPGFDKWFDWGADIWKLVSTLNNRGYECIFLLGEPGTGKSSSMRNLPHNSNVWFNADMKNPVWLGGKEEYGTKFQPRLPYHVVPKNYADIINHLDLLEQRGMVADEKFAILTGHIETYKSGNETNQRLKVLGNLSTKMQLEGRAETVLYCSVNPDVESNDRYVFETQNNGFNTARTPMGMFAPVIPNDINLVLDTLQGKLPTEYEKANTEHTV